MRKIKFRGFAENIGWITGYLYRDETGAYIKDSEKNKRFGTGYDVDPASVGQFTGNNDVYGQEMYEDDIVGVTYPGREEVFRRIIFHNGAFRFVKGKAQSNHKSKVLHPVLVHSYSIRVVVVGSRFRNPELMAKIK